MRYLTSIERLAMEEGERKGHEEGHKEGEQEGRNTALRETVIELLQHRFQLAETESKPLSILLQSIIETVTLKKIINLTLDVESFDDFMAKLHTILNQQASADSDVSRQDAQSAN